MPENITEPIYMSTLPVDLRTEKLWAKWKQTTRDTQAELFQKMLIFCETNGFDPRTAPFEWEEGEG